MDCSQPGSYIHGILQARVPECVAIPFPRGIFPIQGSNPGLLNRKQILYYLSHQGSPKRGKGRWDQKRSAVKHQKLQSDFTHAIIRMKWKNVDSFEFFMKTVSISHLCVTSLSFTVWQNKGHPTFSVKMVTTSGFAVHAVSVTTTQLRSCDPKLILSGLGLQRLEAGFLFPARDWSHGNERAESWPPGQSSGTRPWPFSFAGKNYQRWKAGKQSVYSEEKEHSKCG